MDFDAWFVVSLTNIPYNACALTTVYELEADGDGSKCTLNVNVTYCGHPNSTDVYEFLIIKSQTDRTNGNKASRQRREIYVGGEIVHFADVVVNQLEDLLQKGDLSPTSKDVQILLDQVDELLEDWEQKIPGKLLHGLDKLGTRFKLDSDDMASVVRSNIAVLAAESTPTLHLRGMRIAAATHDVLAENSFELVTVANEGALQMTSDENDAVVLLPETVTRVERRISLVAFRTNRSFVSDHNCQDCQLNSKVLSINVENYTKFEDGEMLNIYLSPWKRQHRRNQSRVCAYWHFHENGTGFWSQEGCTITKAPQGMLDLCQCNHLTHFAEILINRNVFSETDESTLELISIIGCCFSLFGIFIIVLTAGLFKSWRENDSNKIWLHLGSAVFILDVCFLITVFVDFDYRITVCVVVGAALHYSVLATFCWMLVVSILSFRKLVLVFTSELPFKLLVTALFAWGVPFLVIGILFAVNPNAYSGRFEEMTPNGKFCYPKGIAFWVSVFGPMAVMWLINWILYALILRSMFETKTNIRKHTSSKETLRYASISCLLAFLCGIPWVFGFFAYNIVAAYLFSITVTFQGFVLFLFFILGNKKTRGLWTNMFCKRSQRAVITTSTDRSNKGTNTIRSFFAHGSWSAPDQASGSLLMESRL